MLTATAYDSQVDQLFDRIQQFHLLMVKAEVPYRIVGGMAVYIHVFERDELAARLTADVDAAVERSNLERLIEAAEGEGWVHRHVSGVDMLTDARQPKARSAIHLIFLNEKVRADYAEPVPNSAPMQTKEGIFVASVADLVRMKLTSYRLKDRVHIQDMDAVRLITEEVERNLPDLLRKRLAKIRTED